MSVFTTFTKTALAVSLAAFALPAFAESVDFTTTGEFFCGSVAGACTATNSATPGGSSLVIITNNGTTNIAVAGDTYNNFIVGDPATDDLNIAQFSSTATKGAAVNTGGAEFELLITQTGPGGTQTGEFIGTFSGTVGNKSQTNGASVNFANTTLTLGNVVYSLDAPSFSIGNPGIGTTGANQITATVTPEPTFMLLTGLGFAAAGFVAYRRRKQAV
jgi:hypothetical protein